MLKHFVKLEHEIEGRLIQLACPPDTSTTHLKLAVFEFLKYIGQVEDAQKSKEEMLKQVPEVENKTEETEIKS